jgi:hypothetical protein
MSRSYKKHGYSVIGSPYGSKKDRKLYHRSVRRRAKDLIKEIIKENDFDGDYRYVDGLHYNEDCKKCILHDIFYHEDEIPYGNYILSTRPIYVDEEHCFYTCYPTRHKKIAAIDKILTKGKDYSASYADKWSWDTDGKAYFRDDLFTIRKQFNEEVFGIDANRYSFSNIWLDYGRCVAKFTNTNKPTWQITVRKTEYICRQLHWGDPGFSIGNPYDWHKRGWVTEEKEITVEIPYKKHLRAEDIPLEDWDRVIRCYHCSHIHYDGYIHSDILYKLFDWGMIPLNFKTSDQLVEWLRKNEEKVIKTYYNYYYRK